METKEKIYITTELNNDRAMTRSILKTAFGNKNKTIKNKKNTPFRDSVNDIKKTKANVIYSSSDYTKFKRLKSTNQKLIERIKAEEAACVTTEVTGGTFTTQEQLNTLNGCTKINGDITISGFNSTAPDFSVFSCLKEITGYFFIQNNGALTTISGFSSLLSIGDYFDIQTNAVLTTISGFSSLATIGGYFNIYNNAELTTISEFSNLATIGGSLVSLSGNFFVIELNAKLETISGFTSLVTIGNSSVGGDFGISNNAILTTISDFISLMSVGGNFSINFNGKLTTISDFSSLVSVGDALGDFTIQDNGSTATSSGSPNFITTTISSTFSVLTGISGNTLIKGSNSTHKTSITSAAVTNLTNATSGTKTFTPNVVITI